MRLHEITSGPVTITPREREAVETFVRLLAIHRQQGTENPCLLVVGPEERDLLYLVLICGLAGIEAGVAQYGPPPKS